MGTTVQVHLGDAVGSKRVTSRVGEGFNNHRTLRVGILYAITIIVVLVFVARL